MLANLDLNTIWLAVASLIAGASVIAKALRVLAGVTPTTADDTFLDKVVAFFDKIALNTTAKK